MPGVPWKYAEHSLNVSTTAKPVRQKLRLFAPNRKEAIRVEIASLLASVLSKKCIIPIG